MSGLFGTTTIKGTRITDFAQTTATVGVVIPFGYGSFPTDGNVIFAPMPPKEHVSRKKQGKGGVKQETYTYTLSYAVAFCKGPISAYLWIKRNGKIVYTNDPASPVEDKAYSAKWLEKATLYYGTEDQMPDSTMEAYHGAGQVSAHRGIAYVMVEDDNVTDGGGAVPTYEACVVTKGITYATTPPYAVEIPLDAYRRVGELISGELDDTIIEHTLEEESYEHSGELLDGILDDVVLEHTLEEESYRREGELLGGILDQVVIEYTLDDPDSYRREGELLDGTIYDAVVEHTEPTQSYRRTGQLLGGTLV